MHKILLVEDCAETRRPMARLLRQEGYEVLTAADAYTASASVRNNPPDLILLDVGIPPMDGLSFLMLLREDPSLAHPPVILVTGLSDDHTRTRAKSLGVKEYVVKAEYEPGKLLELIKKHIVGEGERAVGQG